MSNRFLKLSAIAAMVLASPALASAQNVAYGISSPVAISSFGVDATYAPGISVDSAPQFIVADLALRFVNQSNVAATTVKFLVRDGDSIRGIVDKGTFSPGVRIQHRFALADAGAFSNPTCEVTEVDFADGSVWHGPDGAVASGNNRLSQ